VPEVMGHVAADPVRDGWGDFVLGGAGEVDPACLQTGWNDCRHKEMYR
jgi:hypothetical protein